MAWPPTTHQDVQDEITNAQGGAASLANRLAASGAVLSRGAPLTTSGNLISCNVLGTGANATLTANALTLLPIYLPKAVTVDGLVISVATAGSAGATARAGIYNSDPATLLPTTVLADSGVLAVDSAGDKAATITTQTLRGLYWLGVTATSGTLRGFTTANLAPLRGASSPSSSAGYALIKLSTPPSSALPDLTSVSLVGGGSSWPAVWLKVA